MLTLILACGVLAAAPAAGKAAGRSLAQAEPFTMTSSFTFPTADFPADPSGCSMLMAGCTGSFVTMQHNVMGDVEVLDDCTFRVTSWEFDGQGPAVEWWAAPQSGDPMEFPYPEGAIKVGELGTGQAGDPPYVAGPSGGGVDDITVRLGNKADGTPILLSPDLNHLSVWCEEFVVDFGNAALTCPEGMAAPTSAAPTGGNTTAPATGGTEAPTGDATTTPASGAMSAPAGGAMAAPAGSGSGAGTTSAAGAGDADATSQPAATSGETGDSTATTTSEGPAGMADAARETAGGTGASSNTAENTSGTPASDMGSFSAGGVTGLWAVLAAGAIAAMAF